MQVLQNKPHIRGIGEGGFEGGLNREYVDGATGVTVPGKCNVGIWKRGGVSGTHKVNIPASGNRRRRREANAKSHEEEEETEEGPKLDKEEDGHPSPLRSFLPQILLLLL